MTAVMVNLGVLAVFGYVASRVVRALPWFLKIIAAVFAFALFSAVVGGVLSRTYQPTPASEGAASQPRADAAPIPWADAVPRWRVPQRCPDALAPESVLPALQRRVDELHALRPGDAGRRGTTAIVRAEDRSGRCVNFVATQTNTNVDAAVRGALGAEEVPIWQGAHLPEGWRNMHAEQKALGGAWLAGYRPVALVASRPFCTDDRDPERQSCDAWLSLTLAERVSDRQAVWRW